MLVQGAFNLLFRAGLRKDFRDEYNMYDPEYPAFLRTGTMDGPEIEAAAITGMRLMLERGDLEEIVFEDPKISGKVVGVDKEFALGFAISRKTVEDDKYKKANQASKWLAHSARLTLEYRAAALLDDAFAGATFKGIDGAALCKTGHTLFGSETGLTMDNAAATPVGFSMTGLNALVDLHALAKDWNGDPQRQMPSKIVISPKYQSKAIQIIGSAKEPFTAENQDNALPKRMPGLSYEISRFKASTESYFLIDNKLNDSWLLTRRAIEYDDSFDFKTDAALYKATTRFLIWFVDFHGWAGANPT